MSQSRHNPSSKQQNPELLTDCASGGVGSRVTYGYEKSRINPEDQCYPKSSHMLASSGFNIRDNHPSSPTTTTDKCLYESQDSGFLSGAITSEQSICSSDDLSSSAAISKNKISSGDLLLSGDNISKSLISDNKNYTDSGYLEDSSMRLDSEYDLQEQFSELDIKKSNYNDLNAPSRGSNITTSVPEPLSSSAYAYVPETSLTGITPKDTSSSVEIDPFFQYFVQDEDGDT